MNRSRYVPRLHRLDTGEFVTDLVGDEAAQAQALALAASYGAEFLSVLRRHLAALDEFGGSIFIAAARVKLSPDGEVLEHNTRGGAYHTAGWVFNYNRKSRLSGEIDEPDSELGAVEATPLEPSPNGEPEQPTVEIPISEG